jgi:hypothetical protein
MPVENDPITEQTLAIKNRAAVVQIVEQQRGVADPAFASSLRLGAQVKITLTRDEPLASRQPPLEGVLHDCPARTDLGDALVAAHPLHGVEQGLLERRVTSRMRPVALGAVVQNLPVTKAVERARRQRRAALVLGAVTLGLDDQHRRPRTTKGMHVGQPVGERLVAKREAAMRVELLRL